VTKPKRSPIDALWDFFASVKLTIVLLILLAATSIIGTLIQQGRSPQEYQQFYGETLYRLFDLLNFFDMYHSWWFLALLGVFALNLTTCSLKRLPRVWKLVHEPVTVADDALFDGLANSHRLRVPLSVEAARDRLVPLITEAFAEPLPTQRDGQLHLFAQKYAWARFGVYVTHLSILIIFVGAIIGNLWGFKAFVNIEEGTMVSQVRTADGRKLIDLGFAVRCDDFNVTYYDGTDRPKEFMSILDIVDGGREVVSDRKIVVNDPCPTKGSPSTSRATVRPAIRDSKSRSNRAPRARSGRSPWTRAATIPCPTAIPWQSPAIPTTTANSARRRNCTSTPPTASTARPLSC
jgi:cytochrome c biogenesis protein